MGVCHSTYSDTTVNCVQSDFDYTAEENQKLLHAFHQSFIKIDNIIKKEDGSLPNFWLHDFRSWLSSKNNWLEP